MNKFKVNQDLLNTYKGMKYYTTDIQEGLFRYTFINTPIGTVIIDSSYEYQHHKNVFMVLLEFDHVKNDSDLRWNNDTLSINKFKTLLETALHNEYMKEWFPKVTEYIINSELKELNELIDYTKYWIGEEK